VSEHELELSVAWQRHVADEHQRLDALLARHREPHRRYHTVAHVAWVVRHIEELAAAEPADHLDEMVTAAFFHDAVYEPGSRTNERASAGVARRELEMLGWPTGRIERVAAMIEATEHGTPTPETHDTSILLDADLAILAADPAGYGTYAQGVRAEYGHLDDAEWRSGRSAVLQGFLDRDRIFLTATAQDRWEQRARANLTAELAALG
jgi:predicted metal-dependent HD superfamily phosphohydrolase